MNKFCQRWDICTKMSYSFLPSGCLFGCHFLGKVVLIKVQTWIHATWVPPLTIYVASQIYQVSLSCSFLICIRHNKYLPCGERNGNPLQYSCLENPMDRGAWCATIHRVTMSQTWLKWLSTHICSWYDQGYLEINLAQSSTLQLGPRWSSGVSRLQCEFGSQLGSPQMHNFPFLQPRHYE